MEYVDEIYGQLGNNDLKLCIEWVEVNYEISSTGL